MDNDEKPKGETQSLLEGLDENKQLDEIRALYERGVDHDRENREAMRRDLRFVTGDQWPELVRKARLADKRPCLTINRLPAFVRQITGDLRKANPSIRVLAGDSEASKDVADIFAGKIRTIEFECDASSVYEAAAMSAAMGGIGNFRIYYDTDEITGENEIYIELIEDPFAVIWDPRAKHPTRKDAGWCFVLERMSEYDFKEAYPNANIQDFDHEDFAEAGEHWVKSDDDTILIAEFIERRNGKITVTILNGAEILEESTEFIGRELPVVAVVGEEVHIGERRVRSSVIRHSLDAQMLYNFARSSGAETAGSQPRAPWLVTQAQIEGLEGFWKNANTSQSPYLPYNPDPKAAGAPQRVPGPQVNPASIQDAAQAADDLKATTGIHDASLGARSNETSGVDFLARLVEADNANSVYADNMAKAVAQCGRVMTSLIPHVYDTNRLLTTMAENGDEDTVEINKPVGKLADGEDLILNNLARGRYLVKTATGKSYQSQKEAAISNMLEFARVFPQSAPVIQDLVAGNMDWPQAELVAERLQTMLPPDLRAIGGSMDPEEIERLDAQKGQAAQVAQARAQLEGEKEKAGLVKARAEAQEAEADANKASVEAKRSELELLAETGNGGAALQQIIAAEVAKAVKSMMQQAAPQMGQQPPQIPGGGMPPASPGNTPPQPSPQPGPQPFPPQGQRIPNGTL